MALSSMKKICRNCHFLSKEHRDPAGNVMKFPLTQEERKKCETDTGGAVPIYYSMNCHMGIWDEGVSGSRLERSVLVNQTTRAGNCFFFPYHPAMLYDAARELQKRQSENEQLKRSNFYTRVGLWVAAGALAANVVVELIKSPLLPAVAKVIAKQPSKGERN
jgi:hypothetical protein